MVLTQAKLAGSGSGRPEGSVLCLPVLLLSWDTKWLLKTYPNLTKCCRLCLNLSSLCCKKQSSTFILRITAVPSLLAQSRKVRYWAEHRKKAELIDWKMFSKVFLVKDWWINKSLCSFPSLLSPQDQVIFIGKHEKPKSPISSWVKKGDTNHYIPIRAHAWLFT